MGARNAEKKKIATLRSAVGAAREFALQVMRPAGIELDRMIPPPPTGIAKRMRGTRGSMAVTGNALRWFLDSYERLNEKPWFRHAMDRAGRSAQGRRGIWGIAHKITATQTAFDVASDAMQIFGHDALDTRYPIEKMFRDARASMIEDGVNEALALAASVDL
jgi:alkylation response protein AidB-like acyl-CoA dehydrogenase